jgi:hypothetical protein
MRSFILKAAIAAALVSITLPAAYAASHESSGRTFSRSIMDSSVSRDDMHRMLDTTISRNGTYVAQDQGEADRVPPVVIYPGSSMATPVFYRGGRLARIESELSQARHTINVDRRRGELTPREARFARHEEGAVRNEAIRVARANGGSLPEPSYVMLQDRVSDLNRTINRYATNMTRG